VHDPALGRDLDERSAARRAVRTVAGPARDRDDFSMNGGSAGWGLRLFVAAIRLVAALGRPRLSLLAQWTSPDTIGADELSWRGVVDPRIERSARRWWAAAISFPARTGQ
jgi:hypothetical protein